MKEALFTKNDALTIAEELRETLADEGCSEQSRRSASLHDFSIAIDSRRIRRIHRDFCLLRPSAKPLFPDIEHLRLAVAQSHAL